MTRRLATEVAVVMQRERLSGAATRWQTWRWSLADVVPHESGFGSVARLLYQSDEHERWLYPGYAVELFTDDAQGYYLNVSAVAPCWFVLWRMEEATGLGPEPRPQPVAVSLSYHDALRWLDAQETVEQVPLPAPVLAWLQTFVDAHYVAEPRPSQRSQSFRSLDERFGDVDSIGRGRKAGDTRG